MIKIKKGNPPEILTSKQEQWTNKLLDTISKYGEYQAIPTSEKDSLLKHYKTDIIKKALADETHNKCAYCECFPGEAGNIEVEHFKPKSLYPELAYAWENLLPSCRKCNQSKRDTDTVKEKIVNPAEDEPEDYFSYNMIEICPLEKSKDKLIAKKTIDILDLNRPELFKARANLLAEIYNYKKALEDLMSLISQVEPKKKLNRTIVLRINNSLERINEFKRPTEKYSGFCKKIIEIELGEIYSKAEQFIEEYSQEEESLA